VQRRFMLAENAKRSEVRKSQNETAHGHLFPD
jgi:hypothetical protein